MDQYVYGVSVTDFGAKGDGKTDDAPAFQAALDAGSPLVVVPPGDYRIGKTLQIGSNTRVNAHPRAAIRLMDGAAPMRGDFLLKNKHTDTGDVNIALEGGLWDYNNVGNPRAPELFDQTHSCGTMLNFRNVRGLTLSGMRLLDPECYYIRMCEIEDFLVEDISFEVMNLRPNQDGVHLNGFCKNGVIRRLTTSPGATNDDLVALNADDSMTRLQNSDMVCGPIENLVIHDISAADCHCFVRMLSVESPIRNIDISRIRGGCKAFVINMDAARYSRTPLFGEEDHPRGVGRVESVRVSDVEVCATRKTKALYCLETGAKNFIIRNHRFAAGKALTPHDPAAFIGSASGMDVTVRGASRAQTDALAGNAPKTFAVRPMAHPYREDAVIVTATVERGEALVLPAGDFDELVLNTKE